MGTAAVVGMIPVGIAAGVATHVVRESAKIGTSRRSSKSSGGKGMFKFR